MESVCGCGRIVAPTVWIPKRDVHKVRPRLRVLIGGKIPVSQPLPDLLERPKTDRIHSTIWTYIFRKVLNL